jgi:hypothetical protein
MTSKLPDTTLTHAMAFYLRQDRRMQAAGYKPLSRQPGWAEVAVWAYACRAAERLIQIKAVSRRRTRA